MYRSVYRVRVLLFALLSQLTLCDVAVMINFKCGAQI